MNIAIRPATLKDIDGIAKVHVDGWRSTYSGIIGQDFLDGLSYDKRATMWRDALDAPQRRCHLIVAADSQDQVVGFSSGGPNRQQSSPFDAEVYAIYLQKASQGQGIGRRLFETSIEQLARDGFTKMALPQFSWVI